MKNDQLYSLSTAGHFVRWSPNYLCGYGKVNFFFPGSQPVFGFAFGYLSWIEPVLGGSLFSGEHPKAQTGVCFCNTVPG